ncbi:MAG: cyclic nucleotide-binding domain-containing protein [bacterium]|nr:cyclic nucleotide-binding domain-containing protein [bacterium]
MLKLFKKSFTEKDLKLFNFLSKNRLFEKLSYEELSLIVPHMYTRSYKENEVIFFSNDPSHALYLVKSGIISLNIELKETFEKLNIVRSSNLFGTNALIEDTKRLYTSIVISESAELYVIPQINLLELMEDHVELKAKLMSAYAEVHDEYMQNLFKAYKSSFGFFDLGMVYAKSQLN